MSESALAPVAPNFKLIPAGLDPSALAPPDEQDDLQFIRPAAKRVKFDGRDGVYKDKSIDDPNHAHPTAKEGLILKPTHSHVLFPVRPEHPNYAAEKAIWGEHNWICRASDMSRPPVLNPDLTDAQREEAVRRGAGKCCLTCALAARRVNGQRVKPACPEGINLLMLDKASNDVEVVQFGGTSAIALSNWLGATFRRGSTVRTYAYTVVMGKKVASDDVNDWKVATFGVGPATDPTMFADLAALRANYAHQLDQAAEAYSEEEIPEDGAAPPQASPPPAAAPHPPYPATPTAASPQQAAPSAGGIRLDPNTGEVMLPGMEDAFNPDTCPF